jgi:hypothetical protein
MCRYGEGNLFISPYGDEATFLNFHGWISPLAMALKAPA